MESIGEIYDKTVLAVASDLHKNVNARSMDGRRSFSLFRRR